MKSSTPELNGLEYLHSGKVILTINSKMFVLLTCASPDNLSKWGLNSSKNTSLKLRNRPYKRETQNAHFYLQFTQIFQSLQNLISLTISFVWARYITLNKTNLCTLNLSFPFLSSNDKYVINLSTNSVFENASKITCSLWNKKRFFSGTIVHCKAGFQKELYHCMVTSFKSSLVRSSEGCSEYGA